MVLLIVCKRYSRLVLFRAAAVSRAVLSRREGSPRGRNRRPRPGRGNRGRPARSPPPEVLAAEDAEDHLVRALIDFLALGTVGRQARQHVVVDRRAAHAS